MTPPVKVLKLCPRLRAPQSRPSVACGTPKRPPPPRRLILGHRTDQPTIAPTYREQLTRTLCAAIDNNSASACARRRRQPRASVNASRPARGRQDAARDARRGAAGARRPGVRDQRQPARRGDRAVPGGARQRRQHGRRTEAQGDRRRAALRAVRRAAVRAGRRAGVVLGWLTRGHGRGGHRRGGGVTAGRTDGNCHARVRVGQSRHDTPSHTAETHRGTPSVPAGAPTSWRRWCATCALSLRWCPRPRPPR